MHNGQVRHLKEYMATPCNISIHVKNNKNNQITDYKTDNITTNVLRLIAN